MNNALNYSDNKMSANKYGSYVQYISYGTLTSLQYASIHSNIINTHVLMSVQARGAVLESLRSLRTAMRALDKILFTSSTFIPPSSSSKEDIKMTENILILFLRNYRRCQAKCLFYESRTTDGSTLEDGSIISWVGSLENVIGVLGIDRLKALAGMERYYYDCFITFYCIILHNIILQPISRYSIL